MDIGSVKVAPPEAISAPEKVSDHETESRALTVCLAGVPNAGKTALMNALTGGSFHTANYPGVTVTISRGKSRAEFGPALTLVDLPGVHSPVAPSPEEELSCSVLEGRHPSIQPDAIIVVVNATQLERHLKFASFVARRGKPVIIALTMIDLLARTNQSVNARRLADALNVPVVPVDGRTSWGVAELIHQLRLRVERPAAGYNVLADLPEEPVEAYRSIRVLLDKGGVVKQTKPLLVAADSRTARIDRLVLHRYLGFPIFFAILGGLFASIFWAAQPFMDLIDWGFTQASAGVIKLLPEGVLVALCRGRHHRRGRVGRGIFSSDRHTIFSNDAARRFGLSLARRGTR